MVSKVPDDPDEGRHPKDREWRVEVHLYGEHLHGLPRIAEVRDAWVIAPNILEIEVQTAAGQRMVIPLEPRAIAQLAEVLSKIT